MRSGRRPALIGLAFVLAAAAFDGEPLYVPGVGLLLLGLSQALVLGLSGWGASVAREDVATRVVEDEPLTLGVAVRLGRLPLAGATLVDPLGARAVRISRRRRTARVELQGRFSRRGRRLLPPPALVLRDPLGVGTRTVRGGGSQQILVLPRTSPVELQPAGAASGWGGERWIPRRGTETEPDGLRPYRTGASAARIYWPALARGAGLVERRLSPESETRPLILLDASGSVHPTDVDAAVRAAGSLCLALAASGGCAILLPGDRRAAVVEPDLAGWPAVHARLAVVEAGGAPAPAGIGLRSGTVLYVAARMLERPGASVAVRRDRPLVLVVPAVLPGRSPLFTVAGCHGYALAHARRARAVA